jgi:hypothetical protein
MPRYEHVHEGRGEFKSGFKLTLGCLAALVFAFVVVPIALVAACVGGVFGLRGVAEQARRDREAVQAKAEPDLVKPAKAANVGADAIPAKNAGPARALAFKEVYTIDWLDCQLTFTKIGKVPLRHFGDATVSEKDLLMIGVRLSVRDPARKYDYLSWAEDRGLFREDATKLTDDVGNHYALTRFKFGLDVVGRTKAASVKADAPVEDLLVFETPVPAMKYLDLDLDARTVREAGNNVFRFRILREAWDPNYEPKAPPKAVDPPKPGAAKPKPLAVGDAVVLSDPSGFVAIADTEENLEAFAEAEASKNEKAMLDFLIKETVTRTQSGSGATITKIGPAVAKVSLTSGPHKGKTGFVAVMYLSRPDKK